MSEDVEGATSVSESKPMPADFWPDNIRLVAEHDDGAISCFVNRDFMENTKIYVDEIRHSVWRYMNKENK